MPLFTMNNSYLNARLWREWHSLPARTLAQAPSDQSCQLLELCGIALGKHINKGARDRISIKGKHPFDDPTRRMRHELGFGQARREVDAIPGFRPLQDAFPHQTIQHRDGGQR